MSDHWFLRTRGSQHGPLSTEELESLIQRNRIADTYQIRVADSDDWLPAADIKAMFMTAETSSAATPSQMASRMLCQRKHVHLDVTVEKDSVPGFVATGVEQVARTVAGLFEQFRDCIWFGVDQSLNLLLRKSTLLVITIVVLLAIFLRNVRFGDTTDQQIYAKLAATWEEMESLRWSGASAAEQQRFQATTMAWLTPTLEELRNAHRGNANRFQLWSSSHINAAETEQALLDAGEALKKLVEAGLPDEPRKRVFTQAISRAGDVLTGKSDSRTKNARQTTKQSQKETDPWFWGLILLDAIVAAGTLLFWWKRRRT